jgi:biopolymer transport protein ExbD/biopolymer transport protein TolR
MAYKPKAPPLNSTPNVIPMADIMLVLLIIFMVVTPMIQKGWQVEMAQVDNPMDMQDADKEDAILVSVTRAGDIYLGTTKIAKDDVTTRVRDLVTTRVNKTVYIKSDARAPYGNVVEVVDEVRAAGVDQVGLLTEKTKLKGPAPPPPPPVGI